LLIRTPVRAFVEYGLDPNIKTDFVRFEITVFDAMLVEITQRGGDVLLFSKVKALASVLFLDSLFPRIVLTLNVGPSTE
jgi:hypothetical protein